MKEHRSAYVAKTVDAHGYADFSADENAVWHDLITRQLPIVKRYACQDYLQGLDILDLPHDRLPQCPEVTQKLQQSTGWQLEPVPALIPAERFFSLIANKRFPAATFIRRREEMDYIQEPDLFHEIFGHCPLLTNQACADFTQAYGARALHASPEDRIMLARLYWFTIEFGLIKTTDGVRAYGGGILSSTKETPYSVDSDKAVRKPFDVIDVLRTPYRIDIMQPVYFVIDSFDVLFDLVKMDLFALIAEARRLGMHAPLYDEKG